MHNWFSRGVAGEVSPGDSITEGIGQSAVTANVKPCRVDQSTMVQDEVIVNMVYFIVNREGLFLGSSSGANLCAAYLLAKKTGPGKKIVTILCDSGQKYVSKIYNPEFLKHRNLKVTGAAEDVFPRLDRLG